jgi:hypothetical protein
MADEVLERESGGKTGLEGLSTGAHDAQERQRVFRLLGLLLEGSLGCTSTRVSTMISTQNVQMSSRVRDIGGMGVWRGCFARCTRRCKTCLCGGAAHPELR